MVESIHGKVRSKICWAQQRELAVVRGITNERAMIEIAQQAEVLRKIIHVDMDCFFAAVEIRDDPSLKGRPVIVGGSPEGRGVVSTCSYEARAFGVRSAMSCAKAYRLCPKAIFVRPNFDKYKTVATQIRAIFKRYSECIEPVSLDEAYLDVTGHELYATLIAKKIREDIHSETQLTASAGVSFNKLIAKIASDMDKPNGLTVVLPAQRLDFMRRLPLRKIPGVGPVTEKRLRALNLVRCSDVWLFNRKHLDEHFGSKMASWLVERSFGLDSRAVSQKRTRKSLGVEETFAKDLLDLNELHQSLAKMAQKVSKRLRVLGLCGKTVTLKVRYSDFQRVTRSQTLDQGAACESLIASTLLRLLERSEAGERPIRLLGVSLSGLAPLEGEQPEVRALSLGQD